MSAKLIPPDPASVTTIREVTPRITTLSAPFSRFGRIKIGGRGTLVKLTNGSLAVFSPVALTNDVKAAVEKMGGNLRYIAALDFEHHIFITEWSKNYPTAKLLGVDGLPEKRANSVEHRECCNFQHVWSDKDKTLSVDPDFDKDFAVEYVGSHANKELVFFYRPDKTLIEGDLVFNLPATEQYARSKDDPKTGILTRLFILFQGTGGSAIGQKRFLWYVASSKNRADFSESVQRIRKWEFERIIPCHGDVIEKDAKGIFEKVMAWHLSQKK